MCVAVNDQPRFGPAINEVCVHDGPASSIHSNFLAGCGLTYYNEIRLVPVDYHFFFVEEGCFRAVRVKVRVKRIGDVSISWANAVRYFPVLVSSAHSMGSLIASITVCVYCQRIIISLSVDSQAKCFEVVDPSRYRFYSIGVVDNRYYAYVVSATRRWA